MEYYLLFFVQILILLVLGFLFLYLNNFVRPRENSSIPKEFINWQQDALSLVSEIENIGKDVCDKAEEKIKILNSLIKEIDEKIQNANAKIQELNVLEKIDLKDELEEIKLKNKIIHNLDNNIALEEGQSKIPDDKYSRIYNFAEKGWSVTDIAKEVQVGKGEVQLILDLKKR